MRSSFFAPANANTRRLQAIVNLRRSLGKRKRDYGIAEFGAELTVTARGDDDELFAVGPQAVGHRHRLATRRQSAFPQFRAGLDIERAQIIIHRCGYEDEPTGGDDRSSQIRRALHDMSGVFDQIGGCSQGHAPGDRSSGQIDADQRSPWRRVAGEPGWSDKRAAAHTVGPTMLRRDLGTELAEPRGFLDRRVLIPRDKM